MSLKTELNHDQGIKKQNRNQKPGTWLRIQLLSSRDIQKFKILPTLFSKLLFLPITAMNVSWLLFMIFHYPPHEVAELFIGLSAHQIVWWLLGIAVVSLFHEFGHVSALLHCGGIPGGIGISMHYLLPKGWSEINDTWRLSRTDCLYVDSGGVFFQMLITWVIYALNGSWLNSRAIMAVCVTSAQMVLINLIPNAGSDGYWLVKDAFGIEDVSQSAKSMFRKSSDSSQSIKPNEKIIIISLLIARNIALIYLLTVVIIVFSAAAARLIQEISSLLVEISSFSPSLACSFLSNSMSSVMVVIIVLQNVISSICQMMYGRRT